MLFLYVRLFHIFLWLLGEQPGRGRSSTRPCTCLIQPPSPPRRQLSLSMNLLFLSPLIPIQPRVCSFLPRPDLHWWLCVTTVLFLSVCLFMFPSPISHLSRTVVTLPPPPPSHCSPHLLFVWLSFFLKGCEIKSNSYCISFGPIVGNGLVSVALIFSQLYGKVVLWGRTRDRLVDRPTKWKAARVCCSLYRMQCFCTRWSRDGVHCLCTYGKLNCHQWWFRSIGIK